MDEIFVSKSYKQFLRAFGSTALFILFGLICLNYFIDPYFIHQWDTEVLKRLSPAQPKITPWGKTYAAYRYHPEVVYLGSSRTEIGLPVDSNLFAGKRVLNLALSGASLGDSINMLRHTSFFHTPSIVVWGLDYGWQFREKTGNTDFDEALVATNPFYPLQRTYLNIRRSISMAMTTESLKILLGLSEQRCQSIFATYGQKSSQCLEHIMKDEGGTTKAFEEVLKKKEPQANPSDMQETMQLFETVTQEYCQRGTSLRFFIHPVHALAELSYWATRWEDMGQWKMSLAKIVSARKMAGCDIQLVDFSGFNKITTEAIPQTTGKDQMQFYWEHSHYRSEVGYEILKRLFTSSNQSNDFDFGVELSEGMMEQFLIESDKKRLDYIKNHPREIMNINQ